MKRLAGLSTLLLVASTLDGCSWLWGDEGYFRDRAHDYQLASQQAPMKVPAGVDARALDPLLPIPDNIATQRDAGNVDVPRPPKVRERTSDQGESVSLLQAHQFDAPGKVTLANGSDGIPVLLLASDFDRAWASVGRALRGADVRVDDLNRSQGLYYINLAEEARKPDEKPGFFARLFGSEPDQEEIDARAERYQVRVMEIGEEVEVSVLRDQNASAPADVARRVLGLIKDNLG